MHHHSFQAFTVTTIFNVLLFSLAILPFGIRSISEGRIALRRLRVNLRYLKVATSRFAHLEKFGLKFSSLSLLIRFNLLHPWPSLSFYRSLLSLWCFSIFVNYYFQVSFNLKVTGQNTVTELLLSTCAECYIFV